MQQVVPDSCHTDTSKLPDKVKCGHWKYREHQKNDHLDLKNTKIRQHANASAVLDKDINILIYGMPFYVITNRSYRLLNVIRLFRHTLCMS